MKQLGLKKKILLAHSPDADDAFMFYALSKSENIISSNNFTIEHILKDIQTLNKESKDLTYDVQAVSFFAYPDIDENYQLLSCGGSLGNGYGPLLVSKEKFTLSNLSELKNKKIAIPGDKTTTFLLLKLLLKDFIYEVVPFDEILESVKSGKYPLGLIIHEGQLSYKSYGLEKVLDLGQWWLGKTNLPVPLGGNVIKRCFPSEVKSEINQLIKKSIKYALENIDYIIPKVSKFAQGIENDLSLIKKFVTMYVNEYTVDYGFRGKLAIKKLYQIAFKEGFIDKMPRLDFVE